MFPVDTTVLETYVVKSVTGFSGFVDVSEDSSDDVSEEVPDAVVLSVEDSVAEALSVADELSADCELQAVTAHIDNASSKAVNDFIFFIDRYPFTDIFKAVTA